MTSGIYDFDLRQGNDWTQTVRFKAGTPAVAVDLTGSVMVFRALWSGGSVRKATDTSGVAMPSPTSGEIVMTLTAAETRALPVGRIARYEIERRIGGTQTTVLAGYLVVREGTNDD